MNGGEILSTIISGTAVLLLAWITRGLIGLRAEFRRFMAEHMWLIATTLWTRDKVVIIMRHLKITDIDTPPPDNLKGR